MTLYSHDKRPDYPPATSEIRELLETYRAWHRLVEAVRAVLGTGLREGQPPCER
jgi:hypothetical protein